MEDHDYRVIEARGALAEARKREPGDLTPEELQEEITRFRKHVRWLIDLADDAADTEIQEEVSQITIWGGVYIAPDDTGKLCGQRLCGARSCLGVGCPAGRRMPGVRVARSENPSEGRQRLIRFSPRRAR
jgi:hypothetical protein